MLFWFDLNKIPTKLKVILDIIVIILLLTSSMLLIRETYYVKQYGGLCVANPMGWAEQYAWEEKGERIDCSCILRKNFVSDLTLNNSLKGGNFTNGK